MSDKQLNVYEALKWASLFLEQHNRESRIGELLLMHHLDMTKAQLLSSMREPLSDLQQQQFKRDIIEHVKTGIPAQHLIGKETFYGRQFHVDKNVLIPRPETEELVAGVLEYVDNIPKDTPLRIVDVGTGSGVIGITLKLERPIVDMWAIDVSDAALDVAKKNAEKLSADVTFLSGNFLQPLVELDKKFDIIVSNPPYIAFEEKEDLQDTVKNFDPELALFAEQEGLAAYHCIVTSAKKVIENRALLAFEIGYQQGQQVSSIIEAHFPKSKVEIRKDINGKNRMIFAKV